ncbi:espin-like [Neltuma alba]|uniref:espin-like n=1 Tax=Neltuma alba TaxID=207710 RepID=UPI0010A2D974|nr:espin-like [Prosopis alba]
MGSEEMRQALLGHLEFTKLLTHKPKLALEFDSFRSTALHLASAEGHIHIVKELLQACDHACLIPDQQGRIPLHYAVIRGRTNIVFELISAKPESLWILDEGKTVFHLSVMYSHLEILKALMDFDIDARMLLSLRDWMITLFLIWLIIRFLLSIPAIREAAGVENETGFTGHKKVSKSLYMQLMLMKSGIKKIQDSKMESPLHPPPSTTIPQKGWRKIIKIMGHN